MQNSRTANVWAVWRKERDTYTLHESHGDEGADIGLREILRLKDNGATVTCYGGPLDHRNPSMTKEEGDSLRRSVP